MSMPYIENTPKTTHTGYSPFGHVYEFYGTSKEHAQYFDMLMERRKRFDANNFYDLRAAHEITSNQS